MNRPGPWARPAGTIHYDDDIVFDYYRPIPEMLCWFFPSYWRYQFVYSDNLEMLFFTFKRQPLLIAKMVLVAMMHSLRFKDRFWGRGGFVSKRPPEEMIVTDDAGETFRIVKRYEPTN